MFNKSLTQYQDHAPQATAESLREPLQPDSIRYPGWFQRLQRVLAGILVRPVKEHPQAAPASLFVPDGRWALLLQDGKPDRLCPSGRHPLDPTQTPLEVRLLSSEVLGDQPRDRLDEVSGLPYERALLYVDGVHVATVRPARGPERPAQARHNPGSSVSLDEQPLPRASAADEETDPFQDFSFV